MGVDVFRQVTAISPMHSATGRELSGPDLTKTQNAEQEYLHHMRELILRLAQHDITGRTLATIRDLAVAQHQREAHYPPDVSTLAVGAERFRLLGKMFLAAIDVDGILGTVNKGTVWARMGIVNDKIHDTSGQFLITVKEASLSTQASIPYKPYDPFVDLAQEVHVSDYLFEKKP